MRGGAGRAADSLRLHRYRVASDPVLYLVAQKRQLARVQLVRLQFAAATRLAEDRTRDLVFALDRALTQR